MIMNDTMEGTVVMAHTKIIIQDNVSPPPPLLTKKYPTSAALS
jgi:hypothetical protein